MQSMSFNRRKKVMRILQICHNLVPRTMRRSHCLKSFLTHWKNLSGKFSPKKTMSGLTTPPHLGRVHRGTYIGNKCLEEEQSINVNLGLVFIHQDSLFDPGLNKFITIPDSIKKVFLCNSALCFSLHLLVKPDCTPSYSRCNVQY